MAEEGTDRLEVWQEVSHNGPVRLVGHMMSWPPAQSTNYLYDMRPHDLVPGELDDGTPILIAHYSLGAGDLEALSTFRPIQPLRLARVPLLEAITSWRPGLWPRDVRVPLREIPGR